VESQRECKPERDKPNRERLDRALSKPAVGTPKAKASDKEESKPETLPGKDARPECACHDTEYRKWVEGTTTEDGEARALPIDRASKPNTIQTPP
jgi:hypothetical protein